MAHDGLNMDIWEVIQKKREQERKDKITTSYSIAIIMLSLAAIILSIAGVLATIG